MRKAAIVTPVRTGVGKFLGKLAGIPGCCPCGNCYSCHLPRVGDADGSGSAWVFSLASNCCVLDA